MSTAFDSRFNYLKQFDTATITIDRPATLENTNFFEYYTEHTVSHNLGYRPLVRCWYEPDNDGVIYPENGQQGFNQSLLYLANEVEFMFYVHEVTTTDVTFRAARDQADGAMSGTFTAHYKIYLDTVK